MNRHPHPHQCHPVTGHKGTCPTSRNTVHALDLALSFLLCCVLGMERKKGALLEKPSHSLMCQGMARDGEDCGMKGLMAYG